MLWPNLKYFPKKWKKKNGQKEFPWLEKKLQVKKKLLVKEIYLNNDCRKTFETDWQESKFPTICAQRKSRKKVGEKIINESHFYYFQWRMWFIIPASRRSCFLFTLQGCFTFCFSCPAELLQLTIFLEFGLMKYSISLDSVKSMYKMPSFFYVFVVFPWCQNNSFLFQWPSDSSPKLTTALLNGGWVPEMSWSFH